MTHRRLLVVATILAVIILAGFAFSVPRVRDGVVPPKAALFAEQQEIPAVTLHDSFKKGLHTITGSIEVPDACTAVSATATLTGDASSTESILVAVSAPEDTDVCLQQKTTMKFSTSVSAPARLPITVTVNGAVATTTGL